MPGLRNPFLSDDGVSEDGFLVATLVDKGFAFIDTYQLDDDGANQDQEYLGNASDPEYDDPSWIKFYQICTKIVWVCKDIALWPDEMTEQAWSQWPDGLLCMITEWVPTKITHTDDGKRIDVRFDPWDLEPGTSEEWFRDMPLSRLIQVRQDLNSMLQIRPTTDRQKEAYRMLLATYRSHAVIEAQILIETEHGSLFYKTLDMVISAHLEVLQNLYRFDRLIDHLLPNKRMMGGGKDEGVKKITQPRGVLLQTAARLNIKGVSKMNKSNIILAIKKERGKQVAMMR